MAGTSGGTQRCASVRLYLTPAGVQQLAQMRRAHQRHEEVMVAALGAEQASALIDLLHRAVAARSRSCVDDRRTTTIAR